MSINELEAIINQAQRLSPKEQLILIKRVADLLAETELIDSNEAEDTGGLVYGKYADSPRSGATEEAEAPRHLIYGEFHDASGHMSTEDDFRLAEWHPTEKDLNGE
jgi:hypothetical protein